MQLHRFTLLLTLVFSFCFANSALSQTPPRPVPRLNKVVWIWLENSADTVQILQRYTKSLWATYPSAHFTSFLPSSSVTQANAFMMIGGSDFGVNDNSLTRIFSPTLIDLLESKNISWKVYVEDFPGSCYLSEGTGNYKRYRVPFLSLGRIQSDRYECMKIQNFANFLDDLRTASLPQFSVLIPNLLSGGANSNALVVDATLKHLVDPFVTNPDTMLNTTVFISTMNNTTVGKREMFTLILGNGIQPGVSWNIKTPYSHANLLRTIEDGLALGNLNQADAGAQPMVGFWK